MMEEEKSSCYEGDECICFVFGRDWCGLWTDGSAELADIIYMSVIVTRCFTFKGQVPFQRRS